MIDREKIRAAALACHEWVDEWQQALMRKEAQDARRWRQSNTLYVVVDNADCDLPCDVEHSDMDGVA